MPEAADGPPEKGDDIQRHDRCEEAISREPKSDQSSSISVVVEHTGINNEPEANEIAAALPFSKGRCIAIVITVAGASFINVRLSDTPGISSFKYLIIICCRPSPAKLSSSSSQPSAGSSTYLRRDCNGLFRRTTSRSAASCCCGVGLPISTASAKYSSWVRHGLS